MRKSFWFCAVIALMFVMSTSALGGSGIWKIKTIAGNGHGEDSGDGGPATKAGLSPGAIALDAQGNIYVASNSRVRKISRGGSITTFAGGGSVSFREGVPATSASLSLPSALAVDASGNVYIAELTNGTYSDVRKVSRDGKITTVVGGANSLPTEDPYRPGRRGSANLVRWHSTSKEASLHRRQRPCAEGDSGRHRDDLRWLLGTEPHRRCW